MILTAHQPAYLPWLGYFHKIALADQFVLLDSVQFEKNSFVNRNKIKTSNGPAWLTIPVQMKGHMEKRIADIHMDNTSNWKRKHWNSLLVNYKKAPFFSRYADFFEVYYSSASDNLVEFISISTNYFFDELRIDRAASRLSELNISSKKQDLIIDLCKVTHSKAFIFGSQGRDYADQSLFDSQNISIYFQEYKHPSYPQLWGNFEPYMGVVDALFNLGPERTREIIFEGNITKSELQSLIK
jgi:hypothetical protein